MAKQAVRPTTAWLPNSTTPRADQAYKGGDRGASGGVLLTRATFTGDAIDAGWIEQDLTGGVLSYSGGTAIATYPDYTGGGTTSPKVGPDSSFTSGLNEVFIKLIAKKTSGGGSKFCKVFGQKQDGSTNYANCTFSLVYANGLMTQVSFGDGTGVANDTAHVINFASGTTNGRNAGTAVISCPNGEWSWPDENFHEFKLHVKFNTGTTAENEVSDGEFHVYIDGNLYCSATNLFNRHYSNLPINTIRFLELTQNSAPFTLTMDDIELSTGDWL